MSVKVVKHFMYLLQFLYVKCIESCGISINVYCLSFSLSNICKTMYKRSTYYINKQLPSQLLKTPSAEM